VTTVEFRQTRALLIPAAVVVCTVVAVALGANGGVFGLLFIAAGGSLLVPIPLAVTGRATVRDGLMTSRGYPPYSSATPRGPVDLDHLTGVHSVGRRYDLTTRIGPAFFRPLLHLQDASGSEVLLWAWGWRRKGEFMSLLRAAALRSNARLDQLSVRRLGLAPR
jgi:hypothetical protein